MIMEYYTLMENENELFVLKATSIEVEEGGGSVLNTIVDFIQDNVLDNVIDSNPIIAYFFQKNNDVDIVVTDQRIIIVDIETSRCSCNKKITVRSFNKTLLDGFSSFSHKAKKCCCGCKSEFKFTLGLRDGELVFTTDTVTTVEEAAAVLAKFDEILPRN